MEKSNQIKIEQSQWAIVYTKIKHENTYKFMYHDIDNYVQKLSSILSHHHKYHGNIIKKSEHNTIIYDLKANFMRVVGDLNLLDLPNMAMCIEYVVEKLIDSLKEMFLGLINCLNSYKELQSATFNKNLSSELCADCQSNVHRRNVDTMKVHMTLGHAKPSAYQFDSINNQLEGISQNFDDIELSLMIDEVLQGKDTIFNVKKHQLNSIYDQIAQYLESIPQSVLNMSRQNSVNQTQHIEVSNISDQLENTLNKVMQKPLRNFIKRVLQYAKQFYKPGNKSQFSTQTPFSKDEQRVKTMEKQTFNLKKELDKVRVAKRDTQKEMMKMIDLQKRNSIKYNELNSKYVYLQSNFMQAKSELTQTKQKLALSEKNKKLMGQKLIEEYTQEKTLFFKNIKQLENECRNAQAQIRKLKKENKDDMISQEVQISSSVNFKENSTQTQFLIKQETKNMILNRLGKNKNSMRIPGQYKALDDEKNAEDNTQFNASYLQQEQEEQINKLTVPSSMKSIEKNSSGSENCAKSQKNYLKYDEQCGNWLKPHKNNEIVKQRISNKSNQLMNKKNRINNEDSVISAAEDQFFQGISILGYKTVKEREISKKIETYHDRENQRQAKKHFGKKMNTFIYNPLSTRCFLSQRHDKPLYACSTRKFEQINPNFFQQNKANSNDDKSICSSKINFLEQISNNYFQLKNNGVIDRITQILEEQENLMNFQTLFNFQQDRFPRNQEKGHKKMKSSIIHEKIRENNSKLKTVSPLQIKNSSPRHLSREFQFQNKRNSKISVSTYKSDFKQVKKEILGFKFTEQQVLLLFGTNEGTMKYQKSQDVWGILNGAIMIDYQSTSICSQIHTFFKNMKEKKKAQYEEFWSMLNYPYTYLQRKKTEAQENQVKQNKNQVSSANLNLPKFSRISRKDTAFKIKLFNSKQKGTKEKQDDPQKLRNIFQKLLRFHQLKHKKCSHIHEFFKIFGLNIK